VNKPVKYRNPCGLYSLISATVAPPEGTSVNFRDFALE